MKIISWNVNGLRAVIRKDAFVPFVKKEKPDILCLQETKAHQGQAEIDLPEYEEIWNSAERKGYAGTAIFTKKKPMSITFDIPGAKGLEDSFGNTLTEGRVIVAEFEKFYVATVYTPNSKPTLARKDFRFKKWDPAFLRYMKKLEKKKPVVFCGDLNAAHKEIDLARPKENVKNAGFTPEERKGIDKIVAAGFVDSYRDKYPDKEGAYTWWTHWANARARNVGWRIDYVFVSPKLKSKVKDAFILQKVMGSDHCPVGIELST